MGGVGSGERWSKRDLVEECRSIDVRRWSREGLLIPDIEFAWVWKNAEGNEVASICVKVTKHLVGLIYHSRVHTGEWEEVREPVLLVKTPCNLGGERVWFICPGVVNGVKCGRRVAILYAGGRYFLCRHCYRLAYQSTRERPHEAHLRRAQTIRRRLGGSGSLYDPTPWKPKGMHDATYMRLWRELLEHERRYWIESEAWSHRRFMRLMEPLDRRC